MELGSVNLIIKVLDCLNTKAVVTAHNVANAGTPGYRPLEVTFERALSDAARKGTQALEAVEPQIRRLPLSDQDTEFRMDLELATASSVAMRYGALIEMLNRQMQIDALPLSRGS